MCVSCILGTGKTHTMLGTQEEPGIMVHTLNSLFERMEGTKDEMEYQVSMGYLEVRYNYWCIFPRPGRINLIVDIVIKMY